MENIKDENLELKENDNSIINSLEISNNEKVDENFSLDNQNENTLELNASVNDKQNTEKKSKKDKSLKIKRLLQKKDIRYKGIFTYRSFRIIGFILLIFAQLCILYSGVSSMGVTMPNWTTTIANVLQTLSIFSLPLFLAANLCVIMANKNRIKQNLIYYSAMALLVYFAIVFVYFRYVNGFVGAFIDDPATAYSISESLAKGLFGKLINYNIFVDLALFSMFYFFMFYTPKNINTKKKTIIFRCFSIVPILFAVISAVLYLLYYMEIIVLPVAVLALLPCRSLTVYAVFIILSILIKIRKSLFIKWGGTEQEYENYLTTKRNSLEVSVLASLVILFVCVIDFLILTINPYVILMGIGTNSYMFLIIPFIFLLSYNKQPKFKIIDKLLPVIFIIIVVLIYLEAGLLILNTIF